MQSIKLGLIAFLAVGCGSPPAPSPPVRRSIEPARPNAAQGGTLGDPAAPLPGGAPEVRPPEVGPQSGVRPAQTFALLVGLLEWQNPEMTAFPEGKPNRRDRALERALLGAGVPRANLVFLEDREATADRMRNELDRVVRMAPEGSTFLFYYTGHGGDDGSMSPYDDDENDPSTWFMTSEIFTAIQNDFRGDNVLLLGDMCHSGLLGEAAARFQHQRIKVAALASSTSADVSYDWPLTEAMTHVFAGDASIDADDDGLISFAEADRHVKSWTRETLDQQAASGASPSFDPRFTLRRAVP